MFTKKFTILLVPEGTDNVRQFKLPLIIPILAILMVAGFSFLGFRFIEDYLSLKEKLPHMTLLEVENKLQQKQLLLMASRIDAVTSELAELDKQEKDLEALADQVGKEDMQKFRGMGWFRCPAAGRKGKPEKDRPNTGPRHASVTG